MRQKALDHIIVIVRDAELPIAALAGACAVPEQILNHVGMGRRLRTRLMRLRTRRRVRSWLLFTFGAP